jgi:hypothetical protein
MGEAAAHAARAAVCGFVAGYSHPSWRDPVDGTICTIYLPIMALHSPQTASGYVQYGPQHDGLDQLHWHHASGDGASQYGCADGHRARRPNHSTDRGDCRRDRRWAALRDYNCGIVGICSLAPLAAWALGSFSRF